MLVIFELIVGCVFWYLLKFCLVSFELIVW